MKYYLIAGEPSGDLHGSNLIKNLKKQDSQARFRSFGGDLMEQAGTELALHYKKMSFIGIMEIVKNYKTIKKTLEYCKKDILKYQPDAVILIDYPGFNLKIAEFAREQGFHTLYYIAPKIWASRKSRIRRIRKAVDKLYVILPFEEDYFKKLGVNAEYLGNPLTDAIAQFKSESRETFIRKNNLDEKPIIALLAGSRRTEIKLCLPQMLKACESFTNYQLILAGAPSIAKEYYQPFIKNYPVKLVYNETYNILTHATAAVVVSGTATLETALFKIPEVVLYKVGTATYMIGRPFLRIKFFSLVNIIMNRELVKEFLQFRLSKKIRSEIQLILNNSGYRENMMKGYRELEMLVGKAGASERAAHSMFKYLNSENTI